MFLLTSNQITVDSHLVLMPLQFGTMVIKFQPSTLTVRALWGVDGR